MSIALQSHYQPGKLVSLRGRDWIVLPSDEKDLLIVKPLGGSDDETTGIYFPTGGFSPPKRRSPWLKPPAFRRFLFSRRFSPPIFNPPAFSWWLLSCH